MDNNLSRTFSERIRKLRTERGMNQGQFADFVGVSRGAMSYYEQEARVPDIAVLKSICEKCGVSADYMLGIIPDQNHAVSDVCLETGLYPQAVQVLRIIKQIQNIQSVDILETIERDFDDPEAVMQYIPFTVATAMVNVLLCSEDGLQALAMLATVIFDGKLVVDGEIVDKASIRLPQAHNYVQLEYPFENLTAAVWVNVQEHIGKIRDSIMAQDNEADEQE